MEYLNLNLYSFVCTLNMTCTHIQRHFYPHFTYCITSVVHERTQNNAFIEHVHFYENDELNAPQWQIMNLNGEHVHIVVSSRKDDRNLLSLCVTLLKSSEHDTFLVCNSDTPVIHHCILHSTSSFTLDTPTSQPMRACHSIKPSSHWPRTVTCPTPTCSLTLRTFQYFLLRRDAV